MPDRKGRPDEPDEPREKNYLGRILIGFIVLAAIMWTLTYLF